MVYIYKNSKGGNSKRNKMKILNLYAGIGGNRRLWGDKHKIIAIENNKDIAKIYKEFFPKDIVIICDAHKFLLEHYKEFDFIWSSPPCPTHSRLALSNSGREEIINSYPNMKLYEEILFLKYFYKGEWVVENVISYYNPLIKPFECGMHYYWSSFIISNIKIETRLHEGTIEELQKFKGFDLSKYIGIDKIKILRNCVEPEIALQIFKMAFKEKQQTIK